jgi:hypothetical protein
MLDPGKASHAKPDSPAHLLAHDVKHTKTATIPAVGVLRNHFMNHLLASSSRDQDSAFRLSSTMYQSSSTTVVDTFYYDILGVTPRSSNAEIKAAYKKLSDIYHPGGC